MAWRSGGDAEREFLTQHLNNEKSEKICAAIREAVAAATAAQTAPTDDHYDLPEIPKFPVMAPLDKKYLAELREVVAGVEDANAIQFSRNQFAQQNGWTRTPVPAEAADRLFEALQNFVVGDRDLAASLRIPVASISHSCSTIRFPHTFNSSTLFVGACWFPENPSIRKGKLDPWHLGTTWSRALSNFQKAQKKADRSPGARSRIQDSETR